MLFFGSQVIAVILAVFLHHGNGRDESANKSSDSVILPMEANPVWRHKRSLPGEPQCYTGRHQTVHTKDHGVISIPVCKPLAFLACGWAIPKYGMRKCAGSDFGHYVDKETNRGVTYPKTSVMRCVNRYTMILLSTDSGAQGYLNYWPANIT